MRVEVYEGRGFGVEGSGQLFRVRPAVERMCHIYDSRGQILALTVSVFRDDRRGIAGFGVIEGGTVVGDYLILVSNPEPQTPNPEH